MLALLLDPPFQLFQGSPGLDQPVDLLARRIVGLALASGKRLGEPGDRISVDRIVLGQPPGRFGKAANPLRIDDEDLDAGRAQGFRPASLITAARLHHRSSDPVRPQPRHQLGMAFRGARRRQAQPHRSNAGVDLVFCDIEADGARLLWHTPTPFLARAGSHAHATVRVEEDARPVPRFPAAFRCGGHGLRSGDGRLLGTAARLPTLAQIPDTRWREARPDDGWAQTPSSVGLRPPPSPGGLAWAHI